MSAKKTKAPKLVLALQHWQVHATDARTGDKTLKCEGKTGKLWRGDRPGQFFMKNYVLGKEDGDGDTETDHWREMIDGHVTLVSGCQIMVEGWVDQDEVKEPGKPRNDMEPWPWPGDTHARLKARRSASARSAFERRTSIRGKNFARECWSFYVLVEDK